MYVSFPDLANESLALRAWSAGDVDVLVRAGNDPELRARLGVPDPYTPADAHEYVALCAAGWVTGEQCTFAVIERATGEVVGSVRVGPAPGGATAGYWTAPWARGRGVAPGALGLVTEWALGNGFPQVRLYVEPDNVASQRVAAKALYRRDERGVFLDPEGAPGDLVYVSSMPDREDG